ncbi:MAG: hypothetical protein CM15mP23_09140 [Cryomorphaceae bacterium]|nr:MAG: hypothetical protein CM15mP23_09140 [Cryomorphaceae bacterium]
MKYLVVHSSYVEYNPDATVFDGSCETFAVFGCTNINYLEFDQMLM